MKKALAIAIAVAWLQSEPANAELICTNVVYGGLLTETQTWQVGQAKPTFATEIDVLACAADGSELSYIRQRFVGLPNTVKGNGPIIWRGRDAQFILDNL